MTTTLDRIEALNARLNKPPLDGHAEIGESLACLLEPIVSLLREWMAARGSDLLIDQQGTYARRLAESEQSLLAALRSRSDTPTGGQP